jgi:ATP-dependent RNA helicase RhlE
MQFDDLGLAEVLLCAVRSEGKTAAFELPILQRLHHHGGAAKDGSGIGHRRLIRAMILTPTRELADRIGESFQAHGRHMGLRHTVIHGGVKRGPRVQALRGGVDILVATRQRSRGLE